jgi:hypothetical protein
VADFEFPKFLLEFGDAQFEIFDCDFGASWCFILIVRHRVFTWFTRAKSGIWTNWRTAPPLAF